MNAGSTTIRPRFPRKKASGRGLLFLALFGLLGATVWYRVAHLSEEKPLAERIQASCRKEYPYDEDAFQRCSIAQMLKAREDIERDKLQRAYDTSR